MKERPIIFSSLMIQAILAGRKTQTRRILKHQPPDDSYTLYRNVCSTDRKLENKLHWIKEGLEPGTVADGSQPHFKRPFQPGMRLWVRETWCGKCDPDTSRLMWNEDGNTYQCLYRADGEEVFQDDGDGFIEWNKDGSPASPWKSPIFMPRWSSRITLEITDVRVERLKEISEADCWAEGIGREGLPLEALFNLLLTKPKISIGELALRMPGHFEFGDDPKIPSDREKVTWVTPKGVYAALWESIHGPGSWDLNPWVFAVSFRRIEGGPQ